MEKGTYVAIAKLCRKVYTKKTPDSVVTRLKIPTPSTITYRVRTRAHQAEYRSIAARQQPPEPVNREPVNEDYLFC